MKCQRSVSRQEGVDLLRANSTHDRSDRGPVIGVLIIDHTSHHPSDHTIHHPSYAVMLIELEVDQMVDRHLTPSLALNLLRDEIRVPINPSQLSPKPWFKAPPC